MEEKQQHQQPQPFESSTSSSSWLLNNGATQIVHDNDNGDDDGQEKEQSKYNNNTPASYEPCFPVISVKEWYYYNNNLSNNDNSNNQHQHQQQSPLPLLDIRSNEEWEQWHFCPQQQDDNDEKKKKISVTVVHIPFHALIQQQRSYELPPRKVPFCLLLSNPEQNNNATTSMLTNFFNYTGKVVCNNNNNTTISTNTMMKLEQPQIVGGGIAGNNNSHKNNSNNTNLLSKPQKMRQPWLVKGVILGNLEETMKQAKELGILTTAQQQQQQQTGTLLNIASTTRCFQPMSRLWEPDPMIQEILLPLLVEQWWKRRRRMYSAATATDAAFCCNEQQQQPDVMNTRTCCWEIWDLGAGSGRDACFLAEELQAVVAAAATASSSGSNSNKMNDDNGPRGLGVMMQPCFRVIAMDQRYRNTTTKIHPNNNNNNHPHKDDDNEQSSPKMFFKRRGVDNVTECRQVDLENESEMNAILLSSTTRSSSRSTSSSWVQCIYTVRYWNRPLVERIANGGGCNDVLAESGAIFAMTTFGKPFVGATWNFAHPKEKHVLERNELADIFRQSLDSNGHEKWRILHDKVVTDSDHGRTLIQFVAKRV